MRFRILFRRKFKIHLDKAVPEGSGYRLRERFSHFYNVPELIATFKQVADIKTSDELHLEVPDVDYQTLVAKPSEAQKALMQALSVRATKVHRGTVKPTEDNMLKITSDGRKLGLDQRLLNPLLPDEEESKVNLCVQEVYRVWKETEADKLTQLVFCDISTPRCGGKEEQSGEEAGFDNVYLDIRDKLIALGIPREEIAFIHEAKNDKQKEKLFSKVRTGTVRVLMGSTQKMGAGTNVQNRLIAIHDLDCPWRPGDLEQRKGRLVRQGNQNPLVHVYRYVTEGTFDAYLWQTIEVKQRFISQIMTSKNPLRSCNDVDATGLSYSEIKALCAGDPRVKERMDLEVDVTKLKLLRTEHLKQCHQLEDKIAKVWPEEIENSQHRQAKFKADIETAKEHPQTDPFCGMNAGGIFYEEKKDAGLALLGSVPKKNLTGPKEVGEYRGFTLLCRFDSLSQSFLLGIKDAGVYWTDMGKDAIGNIARLDNLIAKLPEKLTAAEQEEANLHQQLANAKEQVSKPFEREEEYQQKCERLAALTAELSLDETNQPHSEENPDIMSDSEPIEQEAEADLDDDFELD